MGDVIRPSEFRGSWHSKQQDNRIIPREMAITLRDVILQLSRVSQHGFHCQSRLAVEMGKNPGGLNVPDTLGAISIVSNNAIALEGISNNLFQILGILDDFLRPFVMPQMEGMGQNPIKNPAQAENQNDKPDPPSAA